MRSRGFNIIELMITVAIAGILALVGLPMMTSTVENSRVRSVTNDFVTAISVARSEAVRRGDPMRVLGQGNTPDFNSGWCVVDMSGNCSSSAMVRQFEPPGNLTLTFSPSTTTAVGISRLGARLSESPILLTIQPPNCAVGQNRARRVEVSPAGRPNVTQVNCI